MPLQEDDISVQPLDFSALAAEEASREALAPTAFPHLAKVVDKRSPGSAMGSRGTFHR